MRYLVTAVATLTLAWGVMLGAMHFMVDVGANVEAGVERMLQGKDDDKIETFDDWLEHREAALDKAGRHLRWVRFGVWIAPPGFRSEVAELISGAETLREEAIEVIDEVRSLHTKHPQFAPLIGEPIWVEGRPLPDREALLDRRSLSLLQDLDRIFAVARDWGRLQRMAAALGERGARMEARATAEIGYWTPWPRAQPAE